MRYLKVGLLIAVLSVALAGSLVAVSEQVQRAASVAPAAVGTCSVKEAAATGGCGGDCGGGGGAPCPAQKLVDEAKKQLEAAGAISCPKAGKGEKCDPESCEDCAKASKAAKPAEKAPATCPVHAATAKAAKTSTASAKTHDCKGKDCADCEEDCPHRNAVAEKGVAGKPAPRASAR